MYYGLGSSMGVCGVPSDKDRYAVSNPTGGSSQFLGANGSRQGGYYSSINSYYGGKSTTTGWYDGAGRYHEK